MAYYDLLARIKNAMAVNKKALTAPFSRVDFAVSEILVKAGYLESVEKKTVGKKDFLEIVPAYGGRKPRLTDFKLASTPSRHVYKGYQKIRPVKSGYGISVFSTPEGIMTGEEAREKKVGGEHLFDIW